MSSAAERVEEAYEKDDEQDNGILPKRRDLIFGGRGDQRSRGGYVDIDINICIFILIIYYFCSTLFVLYFSNIGFSFKVSITILLKK